MSQREKANAFRALHDKTNPLIIYNVWDAGSAKAVAAAGAKALATGSWSVAAALGYRDGEEMPLEQGLASYARIVASTDLPVSVDFEGGYAADARGLFENMTRLLETGAIGVNFEDQIVGGAGLYGAKAQAERIGALRKAAEAAGIPAVINARTDLFLKEKDAEKHASLVDAAIERAAIYADAGGDSFFIPGLGEPELIARIADASPIGVNAMVRDVTADIAPIVAAGVSRISFGPAPYIAAMTAVTEAARRHF